MITPAEILARYGIAEIARVLLPLFYGHSRAQDRPPALSSESFIQLKKHRPSESVATRKAALKAYLIVAGAVRGVND
jgi:hypothetical protein